MKMTSGSPTPMEVVVVFATNTSHRLLEAGQLDLEFFHGVLKDVYLRGLLAHHLSKIVGLEKVISG